MERIENGRDYTGFFPVDNDSASKYNEARYDPELLTSKRIIRSDNVNKTRLVNRDKKLQESIAKKPIDDDETFFKNLEKRINDDMQKNILSKIPKAQDKRSRKVRKRKNLFDDDSLNLMKKFRNEFEKYSAEKSADEKIQHLSVSQNEESIDVHQMETGDNTPIFLKSKMSKNILLDNFEKLGATSPLNELDATTSNDCLSLTLSPPETKSLKAGNTMKFF